MAQYKKGLVNLVNGSAVVEAPGSDPVWTATAALVLGVIVRPVAITGFVYQVTTAGTTGASEPTWPTALGGTVTDGTVVFTAINMQTRFLSEIAPGHQFLLAGTNYAYDVASITNDGKFTLTANFSGASISDVNYAIHRNSTPSLKIPFPSPNDTEIFSVIRRAMMIIDGQIVSNGQINGFGGFLPPDPGSVLYPRVGTGGNAGVLNIALGKVYAIPLRLAAPMDISNLAVRVYTLGTGSIRTAIYSDNGSNSPGSLIYDAGEAGVTTTGQKDMACPVTLGTGLYWVAFIRDSLDAQFWYIPTSELYPLKGVPDLTVSGGRNYSVSATLPYGAFPIAFPSATPESLDRLYAVFLKRSA